MFIAYLMCKEDPHLVVEDGISFIAKGETEDEAVTALKDSVRSECFDDVEYDEILKNHVLHVTTL